MPRLLIVACLMVAVPLAGCEHEHHERDVRSEHHAGNSYAEAEEGRDRRSEERPVSEYPEYEVPDRPRPAVPKPVEDRAAAVHDPTLEAEIAKSPDSSPRWVRDPGWWGDHPFLECCTNTATVVVIGVVVVGLVVLYLVADKGKNGDS